MLAVGDISILKPNSKDIPIDKNGNDTAVYLNKEFLFYIDIENKGRLVYSVKPLTLKTENELILGLNDVLKTQLYKLHLLEDSKVNQDKLIKLFNYNIFSGENIDNLLIRFSKCLNPKLILPSLSGIFKVFIKSELSYKDYEHLYQELIHIGHYKNYKNIILRLYHKSRTIASLKRKPLEYIKQLVEKIVDSYTLSLLRDQEIYLKFKVISNIIRYEREFKKKLLNLFLAETEMKHREDLEGLILSSEQNVGSMNNGYSTPVF